MNSKSKFYFPKFQIFLFLILSFSNIILAQQNDIIKIFNILCGQSIHDIKHFWITENLQKYADLNHQKDDILKYEGDTDSLYLKSIFYFVEDSLYMFTLVIKQLHTHTNELLELVNQNFGEPDSITIYDNKKAYPADYYSSTIYYWSQRKIQNNSIDNIYFSAEVDKMNIITLSFSKVNSLLKIKAKALNKHLIRL
jgi:hypothetical protein